MLFSQAYEESDGDEHQADDKKVSLKADSSDAMRKITEIVNKRVTVERLNYWVIRFDVKRPAGEVSVGVNPSSAI